MIQRKEKIVSFKNCIFSTLWTFKSRHWKSAILNFSLQFGLNSRRFKLVRILHANTLVHTSYYFYILREEFRVIWELFAFLGWNMLRCQVQPSQFIGENQSSCRNGATTLRTPPAAKKCFCYVMEISESHIFVCPKN